tara:strand:- start:732 stop:1052 length:321 start_codon:yes stop_codon:yes gene_type:complete
MAHKTYQYCVAENWGKGFITANDSTKLALRGFPGDVWRIPAHNQDANRWVAGVNGSHKTLSEAQAIVDAEVQTAQNIWDDDNIEGETAEQKIGRIGDRPVDITLEE